MNNVLPSTIEIHERYDLKGSSFNRRASDTERNKISPTLKDLDFISSHPDGISLNNDKYKRLMATIDRDCRVLESFQIMDYSFLIGVHNVDRAKQNNLHEKEKLEVARQFSGDTNVKSEENCILDNDNCSSGIPARRGNGERLLLFIGFIDILQSFSFRKRIEYVMKSVIHNGAAISVNNPTFYAKRFKSFMANVVFKPMPILSKSKTKKDR